MIRTIAVAGLVAAALLVPATAGAKDQAKKGGGKAILVPASDLKFTEDPKSPGVQVAVLSGDPKKGASHLIIKLPANFEAPLHHHTSDHYSVVLAGTMVFTYDGQDHTLPAGSYFSFTGKKQHVTKCSDAAGCTLFVDTRGKWDLVPEKTASK